MAQATPPHPYIPNSVPRIRDEMLREIGAGSIEELYAAIPERLLLERPLDLPGPFRSELTLRRHLGEQLDRNTSCAESLSFLGGGCWQHDVPAVVDEIINRAEFVTAYDGETYSDHGKLQALFEYASMVGELVELEAVSVPTYDWATAAASSICMAARVTGRGTALVPRRDRSPERLSVIEGYCKPWVDVVALPFDPTDRPHSTSKRSRPRCRTTRPASTSRTRATSARSRPGPPRSPTSRTTRGALAVVGVDPISLGVLEAPPRYGADIVCGELQPLGIHMHYGGGLAGFIATPDDERFVAEYPTS